MQEAKEFGLNVSKICENALKMAIEQIKPIYGKRVLKIARSGAAAGI
jgi:glycerate kinase